MTSVTSSVPNSGSDISRAHVSSTVDVERLRDALKRLHAGEWDHHTAGTQGGTHGIHPYPAKFIPQIPRQIVELFPPDPGTVVLDPFCGSGTTLAEAAAAGYEAVGIDVHPLATLIAKVKTHRPASNVAKIASEVSAEARQASAAIPDIPRLSHWFEPAVQQALANLIFIVDRLDDDLVRDALRVALSSIIVRVSNQESDTRYAAVKKNVRATDVYSQFTRAAVALEQAYETQFGGLFGSANAGRVPPQVRVLTRDILTVSPEDVGKSVGLVVSSPPYPNAYEYWLYHKYRMYWLGMDPIAVRNAEIGARAHYFRRNHPTDADFERQMSTVFKLTERLLTPSGIACFVVGRSVIHGRTVDNVALLERAAAPHGIQLITKIARTVPPTRKAFNPSHSSRTPEHVLVFARSWLKSEVTG